MKRVQGLDLMRTLAIMLVVALHSTEAVSLASSPLKTLFLTGWIGVDCFFVLSGYLIGGQTFKMIDNNRPLVQLRRFWIRRWWRTLPLYFVALFVYAVIKPMLGFPFQNFSWKFFFFLQNYERIYDFVQSWSLCIEEHFYLIFPFLIFFFNFHKKSPLLWLGFVVLSFVGRYLVWQKGGLPSTAPGTDFNVRFLTHYHLDGIAMGVFLAATKSSWQTFPTSLRRAGALVGLFLAVFPPMIIPYSLPGFTLVWMFTLVSIGFSLLLIGIHDLPIHNKLYPLLQRISLWSYGMYLWNSLLIRLFDRLHLNWPNGIQLVMFFALSILIAIPTYYLVEKPGLAFRDRLLASKK